MTDNTLFHIPSHTTLSDARVILMEELVDVCTVIPNKVEVVPTTDGAALRLYNKNERPTVYHVSINLDKYLEASSLTLDTLIVKVGHDSLKKSVGITQANFIVNTLKALSEQPCDGNKDETLKQYTPLGLLYWDNSVSRTQEAVA